MSVACGEDVSVDESEDKPEAPTPELVDGKADDPNFRWAGEVGFGDDGALQNSIPAYLQFDAYEIEVAQGGIATFEISQRGTSRGVDSMLYLFGPREEDGHYRSGIIESDDDSGWGLLSRIRSFEAVEGGTYLLIVGSFAGEGQYRIYAGCENDSCLDQPEPVEECVFGDTYRDLIQGAPATTITYEKLVTDVAEFSDIEAAQFVDSLSETSFTDISSAEEGMNTVDQGRVNLLHVWDVSHQRAYEVFEYGLGDTSVGTIYEAGTTQRAAVISDADIYECQVPRGEERRDCSTTEDCAAGLRCEGRVNGVGSCIDVGFSPEGNQSQCTTTLDCPGSSGLVCAGENIGGGFCGPAWMRRRFFSEPAETIEGAGTTVTLDTYGLASVHTDVNLDLFISHDDFSNLRVTLQNPSGTEYVVHDQAEGVFEIYLDGEAIRAFPGDEDANGTWTLSMENLDSSVSGMVYEFGLEITSRWD